MATTSDLVGIGTSPQLANLIGSTYADTLAATGTTQNTAYALTASRNRFTTVTGGVNDSCRLPTTAMSGFDVCVIANHGAGTLKVYPGTGEYINNLAVNTNLNIAAGGANAFWKLNNRWIA